MLYLTGYSLQNYNSAMATPVPLLTWGKAVLHLHIRAAHHWWFSPHSFGLKTLQEVTEVKDEVIFSSVQVFLLNKGTQLLDEDYSDLTSSCFVNNLCINGTAFSTSLGSIKREYLSHRHWTKTKLQPFIWNCWKRKMQYWKQSVLTAWVQASHRRQMMSYFKNFIKCKLGGSLFFELLHLNNWGEGKLQFLHQIKTYNLIYSENCRSKKKKRVKMFL